MVEQLAPEDLIDDAPRDALRRGTRLGRYELLVPIAKGGMARVWAARLHGQRGFSKTVAIKTILPHLAEEPEFERMFLDEARIAAGVHHPNVCEIYELGEEGKVLYLAMEWVNGESFVTVLRSSLGAAPAISARESTKIEPIHPHLAARIVSDAAMGLHAAHNLQDEDGQQLGVVHRDVSPHNILLSAEGSVKVADFGVAKALGQMTATAAGQIKGKMAYMAPEQVEGRAVDRRSDIWSLGVVLYEASTGRKPFSGDGDAAVMHSILTGDFVSPMRLVRGYPAELEQIIARALTRDPGKRYATSERMSIAIQEFLGRSGSVVTQSHISALVQQRVGPQLERRRAKIKAALNAPVAEDISASGAHSLPAPFGGTPSVQSGVMVQGIGAQQQHSGSGSMQQPVPLPIVPSSGAPTSNGGSTLKYLLAVAVGVVLTGGLALGGWLFMRGRDQPAPAKSALASVTTAAPSNKPGPTAPAVDARPPVLINVIPTSAVLVVDGTMVLTHSVSRPAKGTSVAVTVQAPGYNEDTLAIDDSSPATVNVTLSPTSAATTAAPSASTIKASPGLTVPVGTGRAPVLPTNPYGK